MDLRAIRAFVAVYNHGSFSKAAQTLQITQPAISRRIQSLETSLGHPLFHRSGQTLALTHAGTVFLPKAKAMLDLAQSASDQLQRLSARVNGPLSLAVSHYIATHHLPALLKTYCRRYPDVELNFHFVESEQGVQTLNQAKADFGLFTLPFRIDQSQKLNWLELWREPLEIVATDQHPLARQSQVTPAELKAHRAVLPPRNSFTRQIIDSHLQQFDVQLTNVIDCNSFASLAKLTQVGLGWGVLPRALVQENLTTIVLSTGWQLARKLGIAFHQDRHQAQAASCFLALAQEIKA